MSRISFVLIYFLFLFYCETAKPVSNDNDNSGINIKLTINPESLKVDTIRECVIWASITEDNKIVKDSTLVRFSSSLGEITQKAYTQGGVAEAILKNTDTVTTGICKVIVLVKNKSDTGFIVFYK